MEENIKHLHIQKQSHNISIFKDVPDNVTQISDFEARKYVGHTKRQTETNGNKQQQTVTKGNS